MGGALSPWERAWLKITYKEARARGDRPGPEGTKKELPEGSSFFVWGSAL